MISCVKNYMSIKKLIKKICGKLCKNYQMIEKKKGGGLFIAQNANIDNSSIQDFTSIGRYTDVHNAEIGKFCAISYFCVIGATRHYTNRFSVSAFPYVKEFSFVEESHRICEPVFIGNDVWIGCHSIIKPNVHIGDGAIIGANSVVTKDVPPYAIVAGVPAKIIKYRFDAETIKKLLDLKWWNFPYQILKENIELFQKELSKDSIEKMFKIRADLKR